MKSKNSPTTGASTAASALPKKRKQAVYSDHSAADRDGGTDSDPEKSAADSKPPAKKQKTKDLPEPQENKDKEIYYDLGGKKRITLRDFKGKSYVDIREFYGDDADLKPGKKGIMFSLETAAALRDVLNRLDELKNL